MQTAMWRVGCLVPLHNRRLAGPQRTALVALADRESVPHRLLNVSRPSKVLRRQTEDLDSQMMSVQASIARADTEVSLVSVLGGRSIRSITSPVPRVGADRDVSRQL